MTSVFRNSLLTVSTLTLVVGMFIRLNLNSSPVVPPWLPPPLCPCWDNVSFRCQTTGYCSNQSQTEPTPTPYQKFVPTSNDNIYISDIKFSPDCQAEIQYNNNQKLSFSLPSNQTINTSTCPQENPIYYSSNKDLAVFQNFSTTNNAAVSVYFLSINKILNIDFLNSYLMLDAVVLPDNHLVILTQNQLRSYDLNTLLSNYPSNTDLYQNKIKSITLESSVIQLATNSIPYISLSFDNEKITILSANRQKLIEYPLVRLYPRSSCPCWGNVQNYCLPQSECLNPQRP